MYNYVCRYVCIIMYVGILQQTLLKRGAAAALMECLRGYIGELGRDEKCIECGCQALRSILMHQYVSTQVL